MMVNQLDKYKAWLALLKPGDKVTWKLNHEYVLGVVEEITPKGFIKTNYDGLYFNPNTGFQRGKDKPRLKLMQITPELEKKLEKDILAHNLKQEIWAAYALKTLQDVKKILDEANKKFPSPYRIKCPISPN